jgi:8-oxo-dGTP pyrophosphatase MutT (NUDIX family)
LEKFTKLKDKNEIKVSDKDEIAYSDDRLKIIKYEDWSVVKSNDSVICVPYLIESNEIILRHEYVPTFKYVDGQEYHVTVIAGGIEYGETPDQAMLRELEEESGIVLRDDYKLEVEGPIFLFKGIADKFYLYVLPLNERDYHEVIARGDGSVVEEKSKSVKVSAKYIDSLKPSEIITKYMLLKVKDYLNITV